jgi:transcriptional regulator GlxA family with amidase domain
MMMSQGPFPSGEIAACHIDIEKTARSRTRTRHPTNTNETSKVPSLAAGQVRQAQDLMFEQLDRPLQVTGIATRLGMSPTQFNKAFKNCAGITPYGWHLRRRIVRSASLLQNETLTLAEIAIACGFSDQSHYTKAFRRLLGITPGRWRRKLQSGEYAWVKKV